MHVDPLLNSRLQYSVKKRDTSELLYLHIIEVVVFRTITVGFKCVPRGKEFFPFMGKADEMTFFVLVIGVWSRNVC